MEQKIKSAGTSNFSLEKAFKLSIILTVAVWVLIMIFLAFFKIESEPVYKTIKISLETTPVENSKPVERKIENPDNKPSENPPVPEKTEQKPVKTEQAAETKPIVKPEPVKTEAKPVPVKDQKQESKPAPAKPVETKPAVKPVQTKPAETKPAVKPAEKPSQTKPADSKPAVKPENKTQETKPQTAKPSQTKPVEQKPAEPKPVSASTKPNPAAAVKDSSVVEETHRENFKYVSSVDDLLDSFNTSTPKDVKWDDSMFDDAKMTSSTSQVAMNTNKATALDSTQAFSGKAGTTETKTDQTVHSETANQKTSSQSSVSASTSSALNSISTAQYKATLSDSLSSSQSISTGKSSDGKISVALTDGTARVLLYPSKPYIIISEEAAKTIDSSRTVTVMFKILANGSVPLNGITFNPSSALTTEIRSEIQGQVKDWRFATSNSDGYAKFEYSIIKK